MPNIAAEMSEVHVAVGVILDSSERVLIARRHPDSHQGGLWEFPGGKVDPGETLQAALARELHEELGIRMGRTSPLLEVRHDYGDKRVWLDVHVVWEFEGTAQGREGQPLRWVARDALDKYRFPEANAAIVSALASLTAAGVPGPK